MRSPKEKSLELRQINSSVIRINSTQDQQQCISEIDNTSASWATDCSPVNGFIRIPIPRMWTEQ